ncbi:Nuclear import receptor, partial [Ascosphaera pollenicola]
MDSLRCVRESSDIGLSDAELELELERHRHRHRDHQLEHEHDHDHEYSGAVPPSADQVSARTNEEGDADGHDDGGDGDAAASAKYTAESARDDSDLDCTLPAAPDRTSQPPHTGAASPPLSFTRSSVRSAIRGSRLTPSIRNASPVTSSEIAHQVLWQPSVRAPSNERPSSLHSSTFHRDDYPRYPDQSFAVLQAQYRLSDNVPPWLRGQPPSHYHPADSTRALATAGSGSGSGSGRPAPGLFVDQPIRLNIIDHDRRPSSSFAYPSAIPEPKETHTVAVDIDEQTGNKLINEYEIVGELGRGEHGKVKLGVHGKTGRKVAIKVVQRYSKRRRLGKLGNPEDKVKKEVAILKKARHPNVVSLLEVIDDSNQQKAYIVLEYVENGEIIWRRKGVEEI